MNFAEPDFSVGQEGPVKLQGLSVRPDHRITTRYQNTKPATFRGVIAVEHLVTATDITSFSSYSVRKLMNTRNSLESFIVMARFCWSVSHAIQTNTGQ
jgi:hypothetical protein